MALLRTYKKATSEQQLQTLIDATLRLKDPFGVDTLILDETEWGPDFAHNEDGLDDRLNDFFSTMPYHVDIMHALRRPFSRGKDYFNLIAQNLNKIRDGFGSPGYNIPSPLIDEDARPAFAVVTRSTQQELSAFKIADLYGISGFLNPRSPYPGSAKEWELHIFWHELAHNLTQKSEPATNLITGIMHRRSVENTSFLKMSADLHCVKWVEHISGKYAPPREKSDLAKNVRRILRHEGWQSVDALDFTASLPNGSVEQLSEAQISKLRNIPFDPQMKALLTLGDYRMIERQHPDAQHSLTNKTAIYMHQRFNLAVTRLSLGTPAYEDSALEKELLGARGYRFPTMHKAAQEYLPAP